MFRFATLQVVCVMEWWVVCVVWVCAIILLQLNDCVRSWRGLRRAVAAGILAHDAANIASANVPGAFVCYTPLFSCSPGVAASLESLCGRTVLMR